MQDGVGLHNLEAENDGEVELSIGAVSRLTGIPAPTIRSWERRHQLPTGRRSPSGYRRYTRADVEVLSRLRDATAAGQSVAEVVAVLREAAAAPPAHLVEQLLTAADRLDTAGVRRELERAQRTHGLALALEHVVLPALHEVGHGWAAGRVDVAHEHLLTTAVQSWLAVVEQQAPAPTRPGPVVLACGPEDEHTLTLHAFAVLLAHRGFDCRFLGARTPAGSLVLAARTAGAHAVVVVSHLDQTRPAALAALRSAAGQPWRLYYAGAAFTDPRRHRETPGTYLGETLTVAAQRIADDADQAARPSPPDDASGC
jgi:MerR family transcriptional regulator, light-induced transcriptional regulator